jgi:hypothetical protein
MKNNKQISQYIKSRPWFNEYVYELYNSKVIEKKDIDSYIRGEKDVYSLSEPLDWNKTKSGYTIWESRNNEFFNWCFK